MRVPGALVVCAVAVLAASPVEAQSGAAAPGSQPQSQPAPAQLPEPLDIHVIVVGTTPLPGVEQPVDRVPAPVQTSTSDELDRSGALDLSDFVNRRLQGVHVNEMQGNPFQPDVNYRGYTASPLLGTPQGLSVYMDGVRLNQPFGDVVSWDLIPRMAIASTALMPGSNPLFGLNTLGGALAVTTKSGMTHPGTTIQGSYGSDLRRAVDFEHGGARSGAINWYLAGTLFAEDGWRDDSPSDVRQIFGKVGMERARGSASLTVAHARNALNGNALQETRLLERDAASVYTKPDETVNRATFLNAALRHTGPGAMTFSGHAYFRHIDTRTFNGDVNEDSLDQALYQPSAAERAALIAAGYTGVPASGATAENTPFPSWRCIGNVLLNDEPAEKCNGLLNRTHTSQHNAGASGQLTRFDSVAGRRNQLTAGAAFDRSRAAFTQSSQLAYMNPDRSFTGVDAFGDGGVTGGTVDGEPYDTRVDLDGVMRTWSVYASDTLSFGDRVHVTVAGRFNRTSVDNRDAIRPGGVEGSLDGSHVFSRFNPAAGVTVNAVRAVNVYAGYNEGSRAATSIELGCADPERPCKLPNAMAGDPPLAQVVTRTVDTGLRGQAGPVAWNAGYFRAANRDDILFVQSEQTGFGYFKNFGRTRREGVELGARARVGRADLGAGYTYLSATFQSEEQVNGESNSTNDAASAGGRGLEGTIEIEPGDPMPLIPRHMFKAYADIQVTRALGVDADFVALSGVVARGNENGDHEADGTYYLGPGTTEPYAVVNVGARYALTPWLTLIGQVNNLFDRRYTTAALLGSTAFDATGTFVARPFPAVGGEFPLTHSTFYAPGAPIRAWFGTRFRF
jgi:outer membrane receptor protein involved in Fe transport